MPVRRSHQRLRNVAIAVTGVLLILLLNGYVLSPRTGPSELLPVAHVAAKPLFQAAPGLTATSPSSGQQTAAPGGTATYTLSLRNTGSDSGTFQITIPRPCSQDVPGCVDSLSATTAQLTPNQSLSFQVTVLLPANANSGAVARTTVRAVETTNQSSAEITLSTTVVAPTATNTPSPTPTATRTPTPSPTLSPTPGPTCPEADDPGESISGADLLLVNVEEAHGICERGDIDFFVFGAVGGKVYTIDITEMEQGLDLVIDLYDSQGRLLTSNDDFYARTPAPVAGTAPAAPEPGNTIPVPAYDVRPRILSWQAPYDGLFYIRIRDSLNVGGDDKAYVIVVRTESYGPTPATVTEICRDLYEEDGLPEEATLITSNELQPTHILCPFGDADWVTFFGKAGKTYYLYTDTRPYRNPDDLNDATEAGADTVLYLFDRDGVSLITFNDDIISGDAGQNSLDSEIRFVPTVDGFYFAQVKNVGDIGNQFIRYDLALKLCLPNAECGRGPAPVQPVEPSPAPTTPPAGTATPTNTSVSFEDTPEPTETDEALNQRIALEMINGPVSGFVDPSFQQAWARSDQPVAEQRVERSWLWGPRGLMARTESYAQAASGLRQVEYFDKGRMEVNNPTGDRRSPWFVTSGLLVRELISGRMQVGDDQFVQRGPSDVPLAGDADDPNAPTYASFAGTPSEAAKNRTGQYVDAQLNRAGQVSAYDGPRRAAERLAHFVPETQHNVPQAFWQYMNARGLVYENGRYHTTSVFDWVFTLGYPLSEPFWVQVKVGGVERDVLVQVFERRVLTYAPDNPVGWQVEMGNVGRHYYAWRYGEELPIYQ